MTIGIITNKIFYTKKGGISVNFKSVLLTSLVVGSMILSGCGGDSNKKPHLRMS